MENEDWWTRTWVLQILLECSVVLNFDFVEDCFLGVVPRDEVESTETRRRSWNFSMMSMRTFKGLAIFGEAKGGRELLRPPF